MDFFNKLGSKISEGASAVASKTKDITGTTKINLQISEDKKSIENTYLELGKYFYENNKTDCPEAYRKYIDTINDLFRKISAEKSQINEIKGVCTCPKCGASLPKGTKFCNCCGTKIPQEEAVSAVEVVKQNVCPNCGQPLKEGTKFCGKCGAPVNQPVAVTNEANGSGEVVFGNSEPAVATQSADKQPAQTIDFFGSSESVRKCPSCGHILNDGETVCPICGCECK